MSIPHFFIDEAIPGLVGEHIELSMDAGTMAHLASLRVQANEHIMLIDSPGHAWRLCLTEEPRRKHLGLKGILVSESVATRKTGLTLVQGISVGDRMDQTIRQTTELGVSRIIPLQSSRSTVSLDRAGAERKRLRWQRIAKSAAEQSCQLHCPYIDVPAGLDAVLEILTPYDLLLFFWEEADVGTLGEAIADYTNSAGYPPSQVAVLIGPEGGFSEEEALRIKAKRAFTITLGPTILRTETAAVVACALVLHHLGALGGS